jgi:hypothetical protein
MKYFDGEEVRLGDIVDVGAGNGPEMRVVVIVPDQAAEMFAAEQWRYLGPAFSFRIPPCSGCSGSMISITSTS